MAAPNVTLGGDELTIEINKGNKQRVLETTGTDAQYGLTRDFVSPYWQRTETVTVEKGDIIKRVYYIHSGNEKGRMYWSAHDSELVEIDQDDVENPLENPESYHPKPETHECKVCSDEFDSERCLADHVGIAHNDDEAENEKTADKEVTTESSMTHQPVVTDGGLNELTTEIHIDYLAAFPDEVREQTVDATVTRDKDQIRIKTPENELRLQSREQNGTVRLYSEYDHDGYTHDQLAYIKYTDDENRISVSWKHADQQVDAITLCDNVYQLVLDVLDDARKAQGHLTVEQAWDVTGVEIPALPLVVTENQVTRGTGNGQQTSTELVVDLDPNAILEREQWEKWREIVQRAGDYQLTHYKNHMWPPEGEGYELDNQLTLHEYINEWHAIDARDVANEAELASLEIGADLSVGDVVTVANGRHRDDLTERQGVIRDVDESEAEITWNGHSWSRLKRDSDGQLRLGRAGGYSPVRNLEVHCDPEEINDELLNPREDVMESMEVDKQARSYDVTVERTWKASGAVEGDRASDLHAEVTVGGPELDDPVTVHCRNVFDFGWTATVKCDLDEDTAAAVKRAVRNNSPIPTKVRL